VLTVGLLLLPRSELTSPDQFLSVSGFLYAFDAAIRLLSWPSGLRPGSDKITTAAFRSFLLKGFLMTGAKNRFCQKASLLSAHNFKILVCKNTFRVLKNAF
jgi:hypothetical protein